ncbi:uncharacterized protein LOC131658070 [Vicia villosa]|uniref:uncharacterized protein LOC131658070 n=1 Tax=Vicia villosa TaxID=3911 RepID=UPI00273B5AAD|nr:uncharacterized protein LOC131658070 [Vicia villosa]
MIFFHSKTRLVSTLVQTGCAPVFGKRSPIPISWIFRWKCEPIQRYRHKSYSFRFENSWLKEEELQEVVSKGWNVEAEVDVLQRISNCALELSSWNKVKYKQQHNNLFIYMATMEAARLSHDENATTRFIEAQREYNKILNMEEIFWKQRAKMHWFRRGDSNSRFFHRSATVHNKFKRIDSLVDEAGVEENRKLLDHITKEELYEALLQMHPDKSPGPDGFNPAFYQHFWELCGMTFSWQPLCGWRGCANPKDMKDLQPISLCNVVYKLIAKMLANRLKLVLNKCVSEEQSAFVEGRSILDNAMVATEIIHALKRNSSGNNAHLALKIDIMHYSVLVNSDRVGPIILGRGLRQGDPLSPANLVEATNLMEIFNIYAATTGQEINLSKSEVFFSRNISGPAQEDLAQLMGVRRVLGTWTCLGLPSMIGRSKKVVFSFIKDRIWKRVNSWNDRSLSKAGKEVMIKSVLQSIPTYIMIVYLIPDRMVNDIEKMLNSFWWGGSGNNKGISLWKAKVALKHGIRWTIGDGSNIKVMYDPWLRERGSCYLNGPQNQSTYELLVKDLLLPNIKQWNVGKTNQIFDTEGVAVILRVPLIEDVREDMLIWQEEQNGEYSVKSGYKIWNGFLGVAYRRVQSYNNVMFNARLRGDHRDAGHFAVLLETLWRGRNNVIWQDTWDDALKIGLQAYHN